MTLISSRYPTHFEGEIQCQIEWENEGDDKKAVDLKSVHTNTVATDMAEYLFLRLKKRSKIVNSIYNFINAIFRVKCKSVLRIGMGNP